MLDVYIQFNKLHQNGQLTNKLINYIDSKINELKQKKNSLILAEIANEVCSNEKTAIFYYGKGTFPIDSVNPKYQHLVTFANAPSQLYGNLLNMLKFKYELKKIKS